MRNRKQPWETADPWDAPDPPLVLAEQQMHWFARNLGRLPIAGIAGVIWQACFRKYDLKFNPHDSPVLAAFAQALERDDVAGLMLRFASYRTQYFQNGMGNGIRQQPRNVTELHALYAPGAKCSRIRR